MPSDETRGEIDLSLSIEDIEQSNADLLRIGGQVIKRLAAIARNVGWRYIEIASDSDEDMPALVGIPPLAELSHAGVQHLVGMETCVLTQ